MKEYIYNGIGRPSYSKSDPDIDVKTLVEIERKADWRRPARSAKVVYAYITIYHFGERHGPNHRFIIKIETEPW